MPCTSVFLFADPTPRQRPRGWKAPLVLLLIGASAVIGCRREPVSGTVGSTSTNRSVVLAQRVQRGAVVQTLSFQAELKPWYSVDLQARVAGYVKRLAVDLGDRVKAGQVLAELDVPLLREDRSRAEATVSRSEGELERARALFEEAHQVRSRLSAVVEKNPKLLAGQELDSAVSRERAAAATLATAQSQLEVSRAELKRFAAMEADTQITAPFAGVVSRLDASPGDFVQGGPSPSGQARPLLRLVQLDRLRCAFAVSVGQIGSIHPGDAVEIRVDSRIYSGRIERIAGEVTTVGRAMMVEADVSNSDGALVPGTYATAVVNAQTRSQVLYVPVEAISRKGERMSILALDHDGRVTERIIQGGMETPVRVEVLKGVEEGELVVVGGGTRVRPGQPVEYRIRDELRGQ